jgi:hypothetical protein
MVEYEVMSAPVSYTQGETKKPMIRFDLRSTNTDPLTLSPEGVEPPTVVPGRAPAMYLMGKK